MEAIDLKHNYEDLVAAIIRTAAEDYNIAITQGDHKEFWRSECEYFFRSDWFSTICDLLPEYVVPRIIANADDFINPQKKRKATIELRNKPR